MRFLHISDLHIGKRLCGYPLLDDQKDVLKQVVQTVLSEAADAVLISGDVYDKPNPSVQAMSLFSDFLSELAGTGVKIFIIGGNHDSADRIGYYAPIVRLNGVYIAHPFDGSVESVTLQDGFGKLRIFLLPFIKPIHVRSVGYTLADPDSFEEAMRVVLNGIDLQPDERNILLCHQFITGGEMSGSEEKSVGGLDNIPSSVFSAFDYVALGHLHGAQNIGANCRYSGTLFPYSFSECMQKKSLTIVELGEKGNVQVKEVPVSLPHKLQKITDKYENLCRYTQSEDYVWLELTDEVMPLDPLPALEQVFPHILKLSLLKENGDTEYEYEELSELRNKSIAEHMADFFKMMNGRDLTEKENKMLLSIYNQVAGEDSQ